MCVCECVCACECVCCAGSERGVKSNLMCQIYGRGIPGFHERVNLKQRWTESQTQRITQELH